MRNVSLALLAGVVSLSTAAVYADTTWISTGDSIFTTAANWNNGLPSTGPQLAIFADSATVQHTIDINGTTARNTVGILFSSFAGGGGFTLGSSAANSPGFQIRAGGTANGILNNDDSTQTFNVAIRMYSSSAGTGAGASQTFSAASGDLVFSGNHSATRAITINNQGGTLTVDGSHNTTIGVSGATYGNISGAGGLVKTGTGTLTLGGLAANDYTGGTSLEQGTMIGAKVNAFGTGGLTLKGGTLQTSGLDQSFGTLDLQGLATLDLGNGASDVSFADSAAVAWASGSLLTILNWTSGSDSLTVGAGATSLLQSQLDQIVFFDGTQTLKAQIDPSGILTPAPIPEPGSLCLLVLGGIGLFLNRRKS
jgi:autotransporter-associated beta strand protein